MIARVATFVWLVFIWVSLLGTLTVAGFLGGAVLAAGLLWYFSPAPRTTEAVAFRPFHALTLVVYFFLKFVQANISVARAVVQPERVRFTRAVIGVPIAGASETATMVLASAVSLTPGTFFLELQRQPPTLYVHVLQLTTIRQARLDILEMERRILLAIGPAGAAEHARQLQARVAAGEFDEGEFDEDWGAR
jgi:multicomponent Na+:H+ antiporter subunit E